MIWQSISMEATLVLMATVVLILEIIGVANKRVLAMVSLGGLVATALMGSFEVDFVRHHPPFWVLQGSLALDSLAIFFKYLALLIASIVILISMDYLERESHYAGEYYSMVLFIAAGILFMASANELITLFIALELVTMPMYALAAYLKFDGRSSEAGLKYFLLGALASGFYLFGCSLVYAALRTTHLSEIVSAFYRDPSVLPLLIMGMLFILAVFAFKIAVAPFHMWAPDVYQGAPTPVTAYLSTGSKIAGVVVLIRVFLHAFNFLPPDELLRHDWVLVLTILSLLSMVVGNVLAIQQKNIKRMLAYSGVAHLGYILIGIVAAGTGRGDSGGVAATIFYAFVYTLTNLAGWAVVIVVGEAAGSDDIKDFAGLSKRSPGLAAVLFVAMLSLAGVPPLAGFVGKFYLFMAAWQQHLYVLVVFGIVNSVISLYYYLGVLRAAYAEPPAENAPALHIGGAIRLALGVTCLAATCLGMLPSFTEWTVTTANAFMHNL